MYETNSEIKKLIMDNLDFRYLIYLYMYEHPEATKASIAKRLGIAPLTLSRAIASEKNGVDEQLVPGILELIHEINWEDEHRANVRLKSIASDQLRYEDEQKMCPVLCERLKCRESTWRKSIYPFDYQGTDDRGRNIFIVMGGTSRLVRRPDKYTARRYEVYSRIAHVPGNEDVYILFATEREFKNNLNSKDGVALLTEVKSKHKVTIMLFDLDKYQIEMEYIIYDPENINVSKYELYEADDTEI